MTGSFACAALRRLPLAEAVLTLWRWCADSDTLHRAIVIDGKVVKRVPKRERLRRWRAGVWRQRGQKAPRRRRAPQKPTGKRKHPSVHRLLEADRRKGKRDNLSS